MCTYGIIKKEIKQQKMGTILKKDTTYGGFHNGTLLFRPSMWAEPPKVGRDD